MNSSSGGIIDGTANRGQNCEGAILGFIDGGRLPLVNCQHVNIGWEDSGWNVPYDWYLRV